MPERLEKTQLMVPVYINEKIVLDMLAIIEDGFSIVSQVSYSEQKDEEKKKTADVSAASSATLLSKLLKIDLNGELLHADSSSQTTNTSREKIHTNVSLLSKFRSVLQKEKILEKSFDPKKVCVGDFIEIEGELIKNPLIDYIDRISDLLRLAELFMKDPELGSKKKTKDNLSDGERTLKQLRAFSEELKKNGTIDFVLRNGSETVVLSAQEQYLSDNNLSEILGGRFKVLGKVIAIHGEESETVDLMRKTSLSVLKDEMLSELFAGLNSDEIKRRFNLPELITKISGPVLVVIPIAIYV